MYGTTVGISFAFKYCYNVKNDEFFQQPSLIHRKMFEQLDSEKANILLWFRTQY